jgi:NAD(P)-dependent dehydrogenase (short-subunit alcohol dehydrogenase family)
LIEQQSGIFARVPILQGAALVRSMQRIHSMAERLKDEVAVVVGGDCTHRMTPMKRMGEVHDVAGAAVPLVSDDERYIARVVLPVDGGPSGKG